MVNSAEPSSEQLRAPFRIAALTYNNGQRIATKDAAIIVIVGPNNSGKSRTLQELNDILPLSDNRSISPGQFFVLSDVECDRSSAATVTSWLSERRYTWVNPNETHERFATVNAGELLLAQVAPMWDNAGGRLGGLASHLVRAMFVGDRLQYLSSFPGRLEVGARPQQPIHWLVDNPPLLTAFKDAFWSAFGMHVLVDAFENTIWLRLSKDMVQDDFISTSNNGLPDPDVVRRMKELPLISTLRV